MSRPCSCGSGLPREAVYDARNIFVAYVCDECRKKRLAGYRPEIFDDPRYEADEDIDGEDDEEPIIPQELD